MEIEDVINKRDDIIERLDKLMPQFLKGEASKEDLKKVNDEAAALIKENYNAFEQLSKMPPTVTVKRYNYDRTQRGKR